MQSSKPRYKSAKIGKALNDVAESSEQQERLLLLVSVHLLSQDTDEIFLFTDVDVQYFQPATDLEH